VTTPPARLEFRRPTNREQDARAQVADQVEAKAAGDNGRACPAARQPDAATLGPMILCG